MGRWGYKYSIQFHTGFEGEFHEFWDYDSSVTPWDTLKDLNAKVLRLMEKGGLRGIRVRRIYDFKGKNTPFDETIREWQFDLVTGTWSERITEKKKRAKATQRAWQNNLPF